MRPMYAGIVQYSDLSPFPAEPVANQPNHEEVIQFLGQYIRTC